MSNLNFVFEAPPHQDLTQQAAAFKDMMEADFPGSVVKVSSHPMGGMRARVSLPNAEARKNMLSRLYLRCLDDHFQPYADSTGRRDRFWS
jgi:hypothetical protein